MQGVFYYYTYLFCTWTLYRFLVKTSEGIDEFIAKPLIWLTPIVVYLILSKKKNKKKKLGFDFSDFWFDAWYGMATGLGIYGLILMIEYIKDGGVLLNPYQLSIAGLYGFFLTSFATGIVEEVTFRGFIMNTIIETVKSESVANIVSTILFLLVHLPLYVFSHIFSLAEIGSLMLFSSIISMLNGYLFYKRKGIVAPVFSHIVWNIVGAIIQ